MVYDWFKSYLCDRYQYTCLGRVNSNIHFNTFGVPQGSVLSPLLFRPIVTPTSVRPAHEWIVQKVSSIQKL
jgi:hypothetical protein